MKGKIRKFIPYNENTKKGGFGFIDGEDGEEYFFHIRNCKVLERAINPGFAVVFKPVEGLDKVKQIKSNQAIQVDAA